MPYLRIKPYDKRRGHVLRRYTFANLRLREGAGWYKVPETQVAYLKTIHMRDGDIYSPKAFDIVPTLADAKAVEEQEELEAMREAYGDGAVRFHAKVVQEMRKARTTRGKTPKAVKPLEVSDEEEANEMPESEQKPAAKKKAPKKAPKPVIKTPRPIKALEQPTRSRPTSKSE